MTRELESDTALDTAESSNYIVGVGHGTRPHFNPREAR